jgi:hypothetical protein
MAKIAPAPDLHIPQTKPGIESIAGRWVRKVSLQRKHALLQARMLVHLLNSANFGSSRRSRPTLPSHGDVPHRERSGHIRLR